MSLREFVDSQHREWRVWDVTPERMHPVTAREMFHGRYEDYQEGWLVFESATERRRLAPFPSQWAEFPDVEMETLLKMAEVVPPRRSEETRSGQFRRYTEERAVVAEEAPAAPAQAPHESASAAGVVRRFLGPSGRTWSATLADRGGKTVLRFTASDGTACDVERYPEDWARYTRERLGELLRLALPAPAAEGTEGGPPRRRREDFRP